MAHPQLITFDTHEKIKELEGAGFNLKQAEAQVKILKDLLGGELATKKDIENLDAKLMGKMEAMEARLVGKMEKLNANTVKWMASTVFVNVGLIFAILKYLH